jgi:hypothetical protein
MKKLASVVTALLAVYLIYSLTGKARRDAAPELRLQRTITAGEKSPTARNLLGLQPYMIPADYASESRFEAKLDGYLAAAKGQGLISERTVAIFPEYIGTWLAAVDEKAEVYEVRRLDQAMETVIFSNVFSFLRWLPFARRGERAKDALFHLKADRMADIYHRVFGKLAARYHVTLVAGSIVLPSPTVKGGRLVAGSGPLYNVSAVYAPSGVLLEPLVKKVFPIADELAFMKSGDAAALPVFATPAGKLGVLICADAFFPATYEALRKQGVELIAVPSYLAESDVWKKPWRGYNGAAAPVGVEPGDVGHLSEGQAWFKYALAGRLRDSGAVAGMNVFLRGRLWNLGEDGPPYAVSLASGLLLGAEDGGAAIINLWLN